MTDPAKVSLGDYTKGGGVYFVTRNATRHYEAVGFRESGEVAVLDWDTGEASKMGADVEIIPLKTPPRPPPPSDSFLYCSDTTKDEVRRSLLLYRRQMEAYADALSGRALRCRYSDCPEGHAVISDEQEEELRVTCPTCRDDLGLPSVHEGE